MYTWPTLNLPPINLYSAPTKAANKEQCQHSAWMILHSIKKKRCYSCGIYEPIENYMPVHQR